MAVNTEARAKIHQMGFPDYADPGEMLAGAPDIENTGGEAATFRVDGALYATAGGIIERFDCTPQLHLSPGEMGEAQCRVEMPDENCEIKIKAHHWTGSGWHHDDTKYHPVRVAQKGTAARITWMGVPDWAYHGDEVQAQIVVQNISAREMTLKVNVRVDGEEIHAHPAGPRRGPDMANLSPYDTFTFQAEFEMPQRDVTVWAEALHQVEGEYRVDDARHQEVQLIRAWPTPTIPRVITMDEYRENWQPHGWELIIIGPTATWRTEWGIWESIRDIVQNALDEAETYRWGYDDDGLWISDPGKGIAVADFLLGPTEAKPDYARGKFGEGMKISALTFLREGYSIKIRTSGREVRPIFLEQEVNGKAESLAALWQSNGRLAGTCWHLIGYFGPAYERYFTINLPKELILAQAPSPTSRPVQRYNQLIKAEGMASSSRGGLIYARDIYVRDLRSIYSYNLWGFAMAPDRHGPRSEADMWDDMSRLWCCVKDQPLLENLIKMVLQPPQIDTEEGPEIRLSAFIGRDPEANKHYVDYIEDNAEVWRRAWVAVNGPNTVLRTNPDLDGLVWHLGYQSVAVTFDARDGLRRAIYTDDDLVRASQERLSNVEVVPDEQLNTIQRAHLELARAIAGKLYQRSLKGGVHAAIIPAASDMMATSGMYAKESQTVYISLGQLDKASKAVDTTIHELAHHHSGAEDMTEAHNAAMTKVASLVVEKVAKGAFDDILKDAQW